MEQLLGKIFRYIPEWLFVLILVGLGLFLFFQDTPLISVCDAQINDFVNGQSTKLFDQKKFKDAKESCVDSPRGTGCHAYFKTIQSVLYDFKKLDSECLKELSTKPVIVQTFDSYLMNLGIMAWGEHAPRSEAQKKGWLSDLELKTFCSVRTYYHEFYPIERWNGLVQKTLSYLVEDPMVAIVRERSKKEQFQDEVEEEKVYKFKKARMDIKKAFDLSLFSMDCIYYQ